MKKLLIFALLVISTSLFARSAWRKRQMAGFTGRDAGQRRAGAVPTRNRANVSGVAATRGRGHGSQARDSISFADENYFRGRTIR